MRCAPTPTQCPLPSILIAVCVLMFSSFDFVCSMGAVAPMKSCGPQAPASARVSNGHAAMEHQRPGQSSSSRSVKAPAPAEQAAPAAPARARVRACISTRRTRHS